MAVPADSSATVVARLCPLCGLCCNGVLFKDVELQPGDDAGQLERRGIPVASAGRRVRDGMAPEAGTRLSRFAQPCAAFGDGRCGLYAERPARCRDFECALLKAVQSGIIELTAARLIVRTARQRAEKVIRLLNELGEREGRLALSLRFKRTKRRFENGFPGDEAAEMFSRLTLAVHDLNLLLHDAFYPGHSPGEKS